MHIKLKRTPGIYLAGFMASGKSTVGRALADRLGWGFVDIDAQIEAREQTSISQIFEVRGRREARWPAPPRRSSESGSLPAA